MVDPRNITNYNATDFQLEEMIVFCCCVAGKNAMVTSRLLDDFFNVIGVSSSKLMPFEGISKYTDKSLSNILREVGIGCYNLKGDCLFKLSRSNLNLRTCSFDDLIKIKGIGFKTANFFLLHTRKNYRSSCLDTHVLSYLRDMGFNVPKSSPQSKKKYLEIQEIFLSICDNKKVSPAEFDLQIWREYSGNI
jgi:thermostable 8-oxoguanine DNA glycosylase